jgi:hypothetical protein
LQRLTGQAGSVKSHEKTVKEFFTKEVTEGGESVSDGIAGQGVLLQ